jgi:26 proteasome complex subunit DSS1
MATTATQPPAQPQQQTLIEDDEFEDFPVEDWSAADTALPSEKTTAGAASSAAGAGAGSGANAAAAAGAAGQAAGNAGGDPEHLWEESWDDDDTNEEFTNVLRYVESSPSTFRCW